MASEQGTVSNSTPLFNATLSDPAVANSIAINQLESDAARLKSLKRGRSELSQTPSNLSSIASAGLGASPPAKSPRIGGNFSPAFSAAPLTGAAAIEDERRKREEARQNEGRAMSENPGHTALASLMAGGGAAMSKPQDAPVATTTMSAGMSTAANAITIPSPIPLEEKAERSPASVTSLASLGSTAQTATASSTVVASPVPMAGVVDEPRELRAAPQHQQLQAADDIQSSNRALTYPGNVMGQLNPPRAPPRGASLPMAGQNQQLVPRSPSQKKHKCPYCDTEFTRHHNLKSHLLTHSQEKPYVCQTCAMRFRRLHDLKRHMKLHTGERPHICPKCDRKFARGDALARHSKGNGGCAGRRASMGSFGGDEDFDESNTGEGDERQMEGVMYTNGTPQRNETEMTEEDRRRFSLPSIKAQHVASAHASQDNYPSHMRTPSTYPPAGPRQAPPQGGLYPPGIDHGTSSSSGSASLQSSIGGQAPTANMSSVPLNPGSGSMYAQGGMTESPKPLSPAGMHSHQLGHESINRQRSPSLTTQFQHQHFGRRQSDRPSPPGMSLPSPHGTSHSSKLPPLPGLAPPENRYTLPSQIPGQQHPANGPSGQQSQQIQVPQNSMHPSQQSPVSGRAPHRQGSGSADSSNNLFAAGERGVWAYVQTLEDRVKHLSDKVAAMEDKEKSQEDMIRRLQEDVMALRTQSQNNVAASGHS
ncbi:hypothetical protein BP6252_05199 [Coleophoma cylindrospora]|uniref:C2H2-type domain-containing protein n=1 Tax=Coleophoma cylindrospora TaxID=1849047 RepID=A0A3D8RT67_9HELO|nr:hypothetical protein BP6252_05199 [Coleophoma cylindrospora]